MRGGEGGPQCFQRPRFPAPHFNKNLCHSLLSSPDLVQTLPIRTSRKIWDKPMSFVRVFLSLYLIMESWAGGGGRGTLRWHLTSPAPFLRVPVSLTTPPSLHPPAAASFCSPPGEDGPARTGTRNRTGTMTESSKTHVILLSCGSFNPITKGHIHMFGEAAGVGVVVVVVVRGGGFGSDDELEAGPDMFGSSREPAENWVWDSGSGPQPCGADPDLPRFCGPTQNPPGMMSQSRMGASIRIRASDPFLFGTDDDHDDGWLIKPHPTPEQSQNTQMRSVYLQTNI